ncbi:DivIVA domain-containing protein [Nocardioides zeae]|uniref:DivIVA domain-containing protein n=2 Tax=Nocardioides zeae TaxID=1457234 RepID=A0AAJ1X172_9ACTN|nr:DivIVA domain-containing protein [Nocardioides zeae]MDQ1105308.1 DivIVA domain-containing protein [Nocardioides zeae]MDR6174978.1 DivIVA domain-containing protein [Nocardioides zeae]MDR6209212.1 DivIVA domain-containing protein [Nocardioides zeae]
MVWIFAVLAVAAMAGVAAVAAGHGTPMAPEHGDRPDTGVPPTGRLTADDLRAARFPVVLRGYRQADVDALLERLAAQQEGLDLYRPPAPTATDAPADADVPDGGAPDREAH